jgi:hypothetical protein
MEPSAEPAAKTNPYSHGAQAIAPTDAAASNSYTTSQLCGFTSFHIFIFLS